MLNHDLKWFKLTEFKHPELVNEQAAFLLDEIREQYGRPLVLTDDARLPGVVPEGGSLTSLHFKGQAFDLRSRDMSDEDMWKLVTSVFNVATWVARGQKEGVELEIVSSPTDHHIHLGFFLGAARNRLLIRAE